MTRPAMNLTLYPMPVRLTDDFCVPGSATVPVAHVGVSPTDHLSINRTGILSSFGL
jgi:hypothetical protein